MEELYKLKKMLCKELEEYGRKGEMSAGSLEIVDKLAHTIKNMDKIIETYEEEEGSSNYYPMYRGSYRDGSYDGSYEGRGGRSNRGGSYAQRRDSRGRYSRYSMDGYSRHGDTIEQLRDMMDEMPDEQTRSELQRIVSKMEQM